MKRSRFFTFTVVILLSFFFGVFISRTDERANAQVNEKSECNIFTVMDRERISTMRQYDKGKFYAVLQRREEPLAEDPSFMTHEKLSIYDEKRKEIFSKADFRIDNFYFSNLTRNGEQLVVETNGGGTDEFLEIYDLRNGKFEAIIDSGQTQMRGGYLIIPEYRTGMKTPYFKPPQIVVIQQEGGADDRPPATVFRFKDGKYKPAGEFNMQELGDFIEKRLSKKS